MEEEIKSPLPLPLPLPRHSFLLLSSRISRPTQVKTLAMQANWPQILFRTGILFRILIHNKILGTWRGGGGIPCVPPGSPNPVTLL